MMRIGKDELICDLAETYHIFNMGELPLTMLATLSCGLSGDSRIKMKIAGVDMSPTDMLLAGLNDKLSILLWRQTKDGQKGINKPELILEKKQEKEIQSFRSGEEYERARARLLKGVK